MEVSDLVVLNYAWMCAKARKMCFDTADAEDLISDTVLRILENSGRARFPAMGADCDV